MAGNAETPTTRIAHAEKDKIIVRGMDLSEELIGKRSFTEMLHLLMTGTLPDRVQTQILDACLVTLMEHGWTPSSMIARIAYDSVPDQVQVGMAAGLLSLGSIFAGTSEDCARILVQGVSEGGDADAFCRGVVGAYRAERKPLPGFGHPLHKPTDPRAVRLLTLADEIGASGPHVAMLKALSRAMDEAAGKPITLNATGAIAAVLLDIGLPPDVMRGLAVVSRSGGLLGHIQEERETGVTRYLWSYLEETVRYEEKP